MILKFGLVVVLLFLKGAFAPEHQPTLSDVDVVSYAQRMKPLSISRLRTHYSAVRAPFSSNVNGFTSSTGQTCSWYLGVERCSLSYRTMKNLLKSSSTNLAKISLEELDCLDQYSKGVCNAKRSCLWSDILDQCDYTNLREGHEDSPCARAAPILFNLLEASTKCGKKGSKWSCGSTNHCQWSSEDYSCTSDALFYYTGIENFDKKTDQVFYSERDAIEAEYESLRNSSGFTWQKYLDYEPSHITCPSGVEALVCKYVDTIIRHFFGPLFYCTERYQGSSTRCDADTLCAWDKTTSSCDVDESQKNSLYLLATKVLIDAMPDGVDKTYCDNVFTCAATNVRGSCKGKCIWNPLSSECEAKSSLLADLMAESVGDSTDGLCKFIKAVSSASCNFKFTKRDCHNLDLCVWDSNEGCLRQPEFLVSATADLDPSMKNNYIQVKKQCSAHHTSAECTADNNNNNASSRIRVSPWTLLLVCLFTHYVIALQ